MGYLLTALGIVVVLGVLSYGILPSQWIKHKTAKEKFLANGKKTIYLTFDDGPSKYTPKLLELLRQNDVKATFFIVSDFAEKTPQIIEEMKGDGHLIGIHSRSHQSLLYRGPKKTREDLEASVATMHRLGLQEKYYRPPWGHLNLFLLHDIKKRNLQLAMWHVMVGDWKEDTTAEELGAQLLRKTRPGSIICLHDGRGAADAPGRMIKALESTIPQLKEKGFTFCRLDERYGKEPLN